MTVKFSVKVQDYYASLHLEIWTIVKDDIHVATYTTSHRGPKMGVQGRLSFEGPKAGPGFFASSGYCEEDDGHLLHEIINKYRKELKLPQLPLPNFYSNTKNEELLGGHFEGAVITRLNSGFIRG